MKHILKELAIENHKLRIAFFSTAKDYQILDYGGARDGLIDCIDSIIIKLVSLPTDRLIYSYRIRKILLKYNSITSVYDYVYALIFFKKISNINPTSVDFDIILKACLFISQTLLYDEPLGLKWWYERAYNFYNMLFTFLISIDFRIYVTEMEWDVAIGELLTATKKQQHYIASCNLSPRGLNSFK